MELSKKVVFFGCCFCVYIGFIGLHNWNKEKKVMDRKNLFLWGVLRLRSLIRAEDVLMQKFSIMGKLIGYI